MNDATTWRHRLSNWSCGALTALVGLAVSGLFLQVYRAIVGVMPLQLAFSPALVLASFVALDFLYYWQHRLEHRLPLLWAIHEVHHQSNVCDTSVSFRTSALTPLAVLTPHLLLALLGVDPRAWLVAYVAHTALVFLLHSRTPAWLDRAGLVFNSPFLHRGHHSTHPALRNRNFGGVFIIWDRLFGTFEARCELGTEFGLPGRRTPLSPVAANVGPWLRLFRRWGAQAS